MGTTGRTPTPGLPPPRARRAKTVGPKDQPCPFRGVATHEYSESTVRQLVDDSGLRSLAQGLMTRIQAPTAAPEDPTMAVAEAGDGDPNTGDDPITEVDTDEAVTTKRAEISAPALPHLGTRRRANSTVLVADELGLSTAVYPDGTFAPPSPPSQWPQASLPEPELDAPTDAPTLPRPPGLSQPFRTERLVTGRLHRQTLGTSIGLVAIALLLVLTRFLSGPGSEALALVLLPAVGLGAAAFMTTGFGWLRTPSAIAVPIVASCAALFHGLGVFLIGWAAQAPAAGSGSLRAALTHRLAWLTDISGGALTAWWLASVLLVAVTAGMVAHRMLPDN
jgi:hypothetical protein